MLMKCPECHKKVSDQAIACPHCGYPVGRPRTTFAELYERFLSEYERKHRSKSAMYAYTSAYGKCGKLYDRPFAGLRKPDLQTVFDENAQYSVSTTANIKKLLNQMYRLAIEENIVDRNYAGNVEIGGRRIEKGVPFTEEEIERIWDKKETVTARIALIMIYSGCRIGELGVVHFSYDRMEGGLKTENGRNRVIPVHSCIRGYMDCIRGFCPGKYRNDFYELMQELKMSNAVSGEKRTPHDCRHTFSWLADRAKMDDTAKHMIMGHSLGKDVEKRVYSHRTFEELAAEIEKIVV
ncbi:MAG: zinc-ribbon domain-containing protein [Lachnospiraceae bacterium]|nr:zinc-ribbon domain-containing protein [Lachnospiraceae bacterium]